MLCAAFGPPAVLTLVSLYIYLPSLCLFICNDGPRVVSACVLPFGPRVVLILMSSPVLAV